jgi:hypothetical protein
MFRRRSWRNSGTEARYYADGSVPEGRRPDERVRTVDRVAGLIALPATSG